jgi:hypothetical protein
MNRKTVAVAVCLGVFFGCAATIVVPDWCLWLPYWMWEAAGCYAGGGGSGAG